MKKYFAWFSYDFFKNSQEKCQINCLGKLVFKIKPFEKNMQWQKKLFLSLASAWVNNSNSLLSFLAKLFFKNKLFILE